MEWANAELAAELATYIEDCANREGGKVSFTGWHFRRYQALVLANVIFTEGISQTDRAAIVYQAIHDAAAKRKLTAKAIITEARRLERSLREKAAEPFVLASSLSLTLPVPVLRLRMENVTITCSWALPQIFARETEKLRRSAHHPDRLEVPEGYSRVRVALRAATPWAAAERALEALDLFRSILNLQINSSTGCPLLSSSWPRPVNRILMGPFHTLHRPDGRLAVETWWYQPEFDPEWTVFNYQEKADTARRFIALVRNYLKKSPYKADLESWMVRYCRALDEASWHNAFLKLWGVLERLTFLTKDDKYSVLVRRASFIFENSHYHRGVLAILSDVRNRAVHDSESEHWEGDTLLYELRHVVEALLGFHLDRGSRFRSKEDVKEFLSLSPEADAIRRKIGILQSAVTYLDK